MCRKSQASGSGQTPSRRRLATVALSIACTFLSVLPAASSVVSRLPAHDAAAARSPSTPSPGGLLAGVQGFANLSSSYACAPGQAIRRCSSFEALQGGLTLRPQPSLDAVLPCYCPGHGKVTRTFTLVVTKDNVTNILVPGAPPRTVMRVNGSVPGPAIVVDEHDWVVVHVLNHMYDDGTVIHWHGMFMHGTPYSDGIPYITQCTIPPGGKATYNFRASQSGTFWYHGHFMEQYVGGLIGPLIINRLRPDGRTEADVHGYTKDLTLMIADFHNNEAHALATDYFLTPNSSGNEPVPDAIVVNGQLSRHLRLTVSRTEKTRLRFVASNALSMFNISIDGAKMTVIETDGTDTTPTLVSWFTLNVAQRVSVVVSWSALSRNVDSVYLRISALTDMYPVSNLTDYVPWYDVPGAKPLDPDFLGIIQFQDGETVGPAYGDARPSHGAPQPSDSNLMNAIPVEAVRAPDATHFMYTEIDFFTGDDGINYASFNNISSTPSGLPTLYSYLLNDSTPTVEGYNISSANTSPAPTGLIPIMYDIHGRYLLPYNAIIDVVINNTDDGGHPIHLHGHAFWIVSSSEWPEAERINRANYPRRDVVTVPASGWVVIRFIADVPGVWAFHCHIDWHMAAGLFATFIEAPQELRASGIEIPRDFRGLCQGPDHVSGQNRSKIYPNIEVAT
jgi:FtsP/CotA-like multicopper oxidase with cupredoxin domain